MSRAFEHNVPGTVPGENTGDRLVFVVPPSSDDENRDAGGHADPNTVAPRDVACRPLPSSRALRIPAVCIECFAEHERPEDRPEPLQVLVFRLCARFRHDRNVPFDRGLATGDVVQGGFDEHEPCDIEPAGCCREHSRHSADRVGMEKDARTRVCVDQRLDLVLDVRAGLEAHEASGRGIRIRPGIATAPAGTVDEHATQGWELLHPAMVPAP